MSIITQWWDSLHETQQQVDAKRREHMLFDFRAAAYKCVCAVAALGRPDARRGQERAVCLAADCGSQGLHTHAHLACRWLGNLRVRAGIADVIQFCVGCPPPRARLPRCRKTYKRYYHYANMGYVRARAYPSTVIDNWSAAWKVRRHWEEQTERRKAAGKTIY